MEIVAAPEIFPVVRALHEGVVYFVFAQAFSHLSDRPVAEAIFDSAVSGPVDAMGHVAQLDIFAQSAAAFGFGICSGIYSRIFEHVCQCFVVVDAFETFRKSIGNHNFGV